MKNIIKKILWFIKTDEVYNKNNIEDLIKNKRFVYEIYTEMDKLKESWKLNIDYILKLMNKNWWSLGERLHFIRTYESLTKK